MVRALRPGAPALVAHNLLARLNLFPISQDYRPESGGCEVVSYIDGRADVNVFEGDGQIEVHCWALLLLLSTTTEATTEET